MTYDQAERVRSAIANLIQRQAVEHADNGDDHDHLIAALMGLNVCPCRGCRKWKSAIAPRPDFAKIEAAQAQVCVGGRMVPMIPGVMYRADNGLEGVTHG